LHRKFGIGPLLVVCVSAGCATQQNEGMSEAAETAGTLDGTLVDQFEVARERATSDFEREILDRAMENGELTQKDYEEAFNRYQECTEAAGLDETFRKMPSGLYRLVDMGGADSEGDMAAGMETSTECADGTLMRVESMYGVQVGNPYLLDDNRAAVIQCLYEEGHVEADYTVEECDRHLEDRMDSAPFDLGEVAHDTCRGGNT